jgi:hypothetical protein
MRMLLFCATSDCGVKEWGLLSRHGNTSEAFGGRFLGATKIRSTSVCRFAMKATGVAGLNKNLNRKKL